MAGSEKRPRRTKFQSDQDELKLRAAYLYYVEGMTQEQVAQHLDISRIKALRLLAATREDGTVQITINSQAESLIRLQRNLEKHLGLTEAIVVPASSQDEESVAAVVGHATGRYISEQVTNGLSIGVGWGATLQVCMRSLIWREVDDMTVISLLGGLTHATAHNPSAVAWRFAEFYRTELYQITAPVFVPDRELADALWKQDDLKQLYERARAVDIALLSVGDVGTQASIFRRGILNWSDAKSLKDAGAVGDVLCHFVDADGNVLDHPVNHRAMAINPADISRVPKVIISSGGLRKIHAIRAGIAATNAKLLITDVAAAQALLELPPLEQAS
ncbi:sugar-binding transcriptional regulator [Mesorhizobium sp. NZP2298]|uniref:sugar-binding transcriptional regulator n=1 Tax=Mesorhizobium sp. NZP2298 TaxID=2483403 RepID=UPI001555DD06|nr:sugar-binding transcriptional regulator [Mesorhizobium sp. NZP2298]QKC94632.1 sugar-binding transcriptional regulator [Mesorhizobium sp. NZP2298]